jgi:hypothetical protein
LQQQNGCSVELDVESNLKNGGKSIIRWYNVERFLQLVRMFYRIEMMQAYQALEARQFP